MRATLVLSVSDDNGAVNTTLVAEASERDVFLDLVCDMLPRLNSELVERLIDRLPEAPAVETKPAALPEPKPAKAELKPKLRVRKKRNMPEVTGS